MCVFLMMKQHRKMEVYAAGVALLGLGYLYTQSQQPQTPPTVVRNSDSDMVSIDLMQKKQWLYGGNITTALPLGLQQRKLVDYGTYTNNDVVTAIRDDYDKTKNDQTLLSVVSASTHSGQLVNPTGQNGFTIQTTMDPGNPRALVVEPYSRSGFSSTTSALATTALGNTPQLQPM